MPASKIALEPNSSSSVNKTGVSLVIDSAEPDEALFAPQPHGPAARTQELRRR
jgi:hypothetical protein